MRLAIATVALVAVQCITLGYGGDAGINYWEVGTKKAVEESVGTPLKEFWGDAYQALVREQGSKALRKLKYKVATVLREDPNALARFLMEKIKKEVFGGRVNEKMWDALTMELYFALKEWWATTPENPREAADLGAWHSMIKLYKEVMGPALRGSNRVGLMNELFLDPELKDIKAWVDEWKGVSKKAPAANENKELKVPKS